MIVDDADFRNADGVLDYCKYIAARVANGDYCGVCGRIRLAFGDGKVWTCNNCAWMRRENGPVSHPTHVRCPACEFIFSIPEEGTEHCEGEHTTDCPNCENEFTMSTHIFYRYDSPKLIEKKQEQTTDQGQ